MKPANLLFILSDEHSRRVLGCYGHGIIRTPNLDRLAAQGVRFSDAYCNSPICVPSRAALATGRHVHKIRFWDNAIPYDGSVPSWHHRLRDAGHEVTAIGKLHFRSADDDNGFTEEIMPLHVVDGIGDPMGWLRDPLPVRRAALRLAADAGRGNSSYQDYDDRIVAAAGECQIYDKGFDDVKVRRAIAAYFGLVSKIDHHVGELLDVLAASGLTDNTRVLYSSDHGDNLGVRGLWGKSNMYEEAAGVPMILAGREVPQGVVCRQPVSLVDCFPTIIAGAGLAPHPGDRDLPGASLLEVARGTGPRRMILSEYHATGAATGAFMIRKGPFKYVHYVGMPPQLFDLDADPQETRDLGREPGYRDLLARCEAELRLVVDPDAADASAKADQRARIAAFGGREAILARGSFGYSPTPGTKALYN